MLSLRGRIVTADAMSCQRAICAQIVDQEGGCVIALKGNQGTLHADVVPFPGGSGAAAAEPSRTTVDNAQGRMEARTGEVCADIAWLQEQHAWPGLAAVGKTARTHEASTKTTTESTY